MEGWNKVKVFAATKQKEREELGETVTRWIQTNKPELIDKKVLQSSDSEYHCITIVLFYK